MRVPEKRRELGFGARVRARIGSLRGRWAALGVQWGRSLQIKVATSTLALSAAVVFVLGMVLQNEITDRLLNSKIDAAVAQTRSSVDLLEANLLSFSSGGESTQSELVGARDKLASSSAEPSMQETVSSAAGAFEPVLADGSAGNSGGAAAGPYSDVPQELREFVANGKLSWQIQTVQRDGSPTTFLVLGAPVRSATKSLQLYLLFPLASEQRTVEVVQSTLIVGGLVVLLLLAGITNLVVRQVVRPVRAAAEVAEQLAEGRLSERLRVVGEDDVARLAESYNAMADSIQRQISQLEEFGQLQRRFTSDVSHELRTPLTTVRMAADVLHASREQFPAGLSRSTELLVDELDRFEALLGDLLEISRLDAGVEELSTELVDLRAIAASAAESVRGITGDDVGRIEFVDTESVVAEVDARRVERILRNLLANAVDHSENKPVRVTMGGNAKAVAVVVRDFGVGLRPGEAELVFNRFWRADPSRNRRTGGTGLGLAISVEDARLHGGWLQAWGSPGQGAAFRLTLPRRPGITLTGSPLPLTPDEAEEPGRVRADRRNGRPSTVHSGYTSNGHNGQTIVDGDAAQGEPEYGGTEYGDPEYDDVDYDFPEETWSDGGMIRRSVPSPDGEPETRSSESSVEGSLR